jgi:hypothetical protein
VSEPKVIYLGPACEAGTGDGRTWAEDNPWPDCECGHRPVQYVLGETFDRMKAERDALQLRLNAADQRIDELTLRSIEHPEGKRERFEKWVMATKHPVFGFLDGRSLARSDDRTGYADEYVQGLWVAYLAFGGFASRDDSIGWLKRIDGIGQNRAEIICSMGFRRLAD